MLGGPTQDPMFHREYSEATQQYVDEEIARMVEFRYVHVKDSLAGRRELLDKVAHLLLEKETIDEKEFKAALNEEAALEAG
jgi:cell division protease FtsH